MKEITSLSNLQDLMNQKTLVLVDFSATWCGPCKALHPKLVQMAKDRPEVTFVMVDVDVIDSDTFGVRAMPTLQLWRDGAKLDQVVGANLDGIVAMLDEHASVQEPTTNGQEPNKVQ